MEASLYIHIPFCAYGKCDYCDFYSVPLVSPEPWLSDPRPTRFVDALLSEGERLFLKYAPRKIPTIYIGGGTPSVLGPAGILRLLRGISHIVSRYSPPPLEITVEANPESADEAFLAAAREAGATRLSLGVQTFHGPSRQAIHRGGAALTASGQPDCTTLLSRRLSLAAQYFPDAFSADLISGFPFQDERILLDDIDALLSFRPAHVSLYALTVEPGTPLAASAGAGDEADRLWISGRDALEKAGYGQYEVSNFCLSHRESRHNIRYWRMQNWLALGPAASGTIINEETGTGFRYTIPSDLDAWLSKTMTDTFFEELDTLTLIKESFLMGFRYLEGPDELLFRQRFRRNIPDLIPNTVSLWRERGLLRKDKAILTKEGLLFLNPFLLEVFDELDASFSAC